MPEFVLLSTVITMICEFVSAWNDVLSSTRPFAGEWGNYLQSEFFGSFFIRKLLFMVRERHSVLQIPAKLQHVKKVLTVTARESWN